MLREDGMKILANTGYGCGLQPDLRYPIIQEFPQGGTIGGTIACDSLSHPQGLMLSTLSGTGRVRGLILGLGLNPLQSSHMRGLCHWYPVAVLAPGSATGAIMRKERPR